MFISSIHLTPSNHPNLNLNLHVLPLKPKLQSVIAVVVIKIHVLVPSRSVSPIL